MAMDLEAVKTMFPTVVPMVGTLNLRFDGLTADEAVMVLPDQKEYHNHIAGPHAGAMFTLAESASGALVLANFGDRMAEVTPLAVSAQIRYLAVAMGDVTGTARMTRTADDVLAELAEGKRPEFAVEIELSAGGKVTGQMTVVWTLRANKN
jgi:acyl-coenzyme A thioesterase PaaI-like protein